MCPVASCQERAKRTLGHIQLAVSRLKTLILLSLQTAAPDPASNHNISDACKKRITMSQDHSPEVTNEDFSNFENTC
ncbi:hypothetical protein ABO04_11440 [Nitrosomonas sp. HPC101]|nr:hypothetical protein [Nitrosomonas sp. HPC101]